MSVRDVEDRNPNESLSIVMSVSHPYVEQLDCIMQSIFGTLRSLVNPGVDRTVASEKLNAASIALAALKNLYSYEWNKQQTAQIDGIINQVGSMQADLAARASHVGTTPEILETAFRRMNAWRSEDDPSKHQSLADYIDGRTERPTVDAPERPSTPAPGTSGGLGRCASIAEEEDAEDMGTMAAMSTAALMTAMQLEDGVFDAATDAATAERKRTGEPHEEHDAPRQGSPTPSPRPPRPITLDDSELRLEIDRARKDRGGFGNKGLWFAINNHGLGTDGKRVAGESLLKVLDEAEWRVMLTTLETMGLECKVVQAPGSQDIVSQVNSITHGSQMLAVVYYGIEFMVNSDGHGTGDPRAKLLSKALSDVEFAWPYVCMYANLIEIDDGGTVDLEDHAPVCETEVFSSPMKMRRVPRSAKKQPKPPPKASSLYTGLKRGFLNSPSPPHADDDVAKRYTPATAAQRLGEEDALDDEPSWVEVPNTTYPSGASKIFREEARKLEMRAKEQAALGDNQSAYKTSAEAMKWMLKAARSEQQDATRGAEPTTMPDGTELPPETKVYKPKVDYVYTDGTVRSVAAGWYTESEHLARSMEEQELLTTVNDIMERDGIRPKNLSRDPEPCWVLKPKVGVEKTEELTRDNSEVFCVNSKDFHGCGLEMPTAPAWDVVRDDVLAMARSAVDAGVQIVQGHDKHREQTMAA